MSFTAVIAPICTVVAVCLIWPQVFRVYRLGSVEGLSSFGTLHGLSGCTLWTIYGIAREITPVIISNAAIGAALSTIAVAQVRHRALQTRYVVLTLVAATGIGVAALSISTGFLGWAAILVAVTSVLPQTIRAAVADDLSAVSLPTNCLVVANGALWILYGALIGDLQLMVINALIAPCAAFIALRAWRSQAAARPLLAV
jgi:uncharacterized protein with PQ loop repeat